MKRPKRLLSVLLLVTLWSCGARPPAPDREILARGDFAGLEGKGARFELIRSQDDLAALYRRLFAGRLPLPAVPEVDFSRSLVILVVMEEQPTAGYRIELPPPFRQDAALVVPVLFHSPPPEGFQAAVLTRPFVLMRVARPEGVAEVRFIGPDGENLARAALQ